MYACITSRFKQFQLITGYMHDNKTSLAHLLYCHKRMQSCCQHCRRKSADWDGTCQSTAAAHLSRSAAAHAGRTRCWQHAASQSSQVTDFVECHSQTVSTLQPTYCAGGSTQAVILTAVKTQHPTVVNTVPFSGNYTL